MTLPSATTSASIQLALPPGSVIPYMGSAESLEGLRALGWLVCNGAQVSRNTYPDLYRAIGQTYGGDGNPNFNLPNLQGAFLRGVDAAGTADPDRNSRTGPYPGDEKVVGPAVGSRQGDQLRNHQHNWDGNFGQITSSGSALNVQLCSGTGDLGRMPTTNVDGGGNETRPFNVYVFYLIATGLPQTGQ